MAESPRRRILAHVRLADICCVIGLALNFMWCSLEGHALRFAETAAQFQFPLNPRGFWLMGFCLLALLYLAVPHWLKRWENTLKGIVPLCGAAGTLAFATAPLQSAVPPLALGLAGLAVSGTRLLLVRLALLHPHGPCSLDHGHCLGHRRRRAFEDLPFARCNRSAGFRGPGSLRLRHSHLELVASLDRPAFPWRHRQYSVSHAPCAREGSPFRPSATSYCCSFSAPSFLPPCVDSASGEHGARPQRFPLRPYGAFRSWP